MEKRLQRQTKLPVSDSVGTNLIICFLLAIQSSFYTTTVQGGAERFLLFFSLDRLAATALSNRRAL